MSFSEWKTYQLGELLEVKYGKDHKALSEGKIPAYGSGGIMRYVDKAIYDEVSILIPRKGSLNNIYYLNKPFWTVDTMFWTKVNQKLVNPKFLYYKLTTFNYSDMNVGSAVPSMTVPVLNEMEIVAPDIKTQKRIASILSCLDDAIELNQQINKTLEEMAKAIFKEWFIDFNFPSTGSGQRPNAKGKFQETEIGKIPVGWKVGKLEDVAEINPKLSLKKGLIRKYVEMKDLSEDSSIIKNFREGEFSSGSKFQNGDTLLARITPCLENGKTGLVTFLDENEAGWGSTEFIVLRGKGNVGSNFIYCLSRFEPFRNHAVKSMLGSSGRQRVVESMLIEFALAIPSNELLINFEKLVTPFFVQINNNEKENQYLSNLRDILLPKLMKGEIVINIKADVAKI